MHGPMNLKAFYDPEDIIIVFNKTLWIQVYKNNTQ